MGKIIFRMLLGACAALLGWAIFEPTRPSVMPGADPDAWNTFESHMILSWGILIGIAVAGYNGYLQGSRMAIIRGIALGGLLGGIGASLGIPLGEKLVHVVFGASFEQLSAMGDARAILARWTALTPLGALIGAGIGLSTLDWRRGLHGLIGGAIGGLIGAVLFDTVGSVFAAMSLAAQGLQAGEVGQIPRAIFALSMGSMVALFVGLMEQIARTAWVRQALGRNEGREWALYGTRNMIGRNERAQIPLFGDMGIAPVHAFIDRQGPNYYLLDAGSGAATLLNGQPVQSAPLFNGAQIQVGNTILQFLLRGAARAPTNYMAPIVQPVQPMPQVVLPDAYVHPQPMPQPVFPQPVPAPVQVSAPVLVATDGPLAGQRFRIVGELEIGREAPVVRLSFDSAVSRRHASISPSPSGPLLRDLGSTNGTLVNGQRVTTATLKPGDLVKIGATTFRLE